MDMCSSKLPSSLKLGEFFLQHVDPIRGTNKSSVFQESKIMKVKNEKEGIAACYFDSPFDVTTESLNWSYDYESATIGEEEEEKVIPMAETIIMNGKIRGDEKDQVAEAEL